MYLKALENSKKVFSFGLIKTNKINKQKKRHSPTVLFSTCSMYSQKWDEAAQ